MEIYIALGLLVALFAYREWRSQTLEDKLISFSENVTKEAAGERRHLITQIQTPEVAPFLEASPAPPPIVTDEEYWSETEVSVNGDS